MGDQQHWNNVYTQKQVQDTSWYESVPKISIDLINSLGLNENCSVIDVGGGASNLVDFLVSKFKRVVVLDISERAIAIAKQRVGPTSKVEFIIGDILLQSNLGNFDVWHDRAVFHFLVTVKQQQDYVNLAKNSIKVGGFLIIATFSLNGPEKCSNLPVCRYSAQSLLLMFEPWFRMRKSMQHTHLTPWNSKQEFTFLVLERSD